MDVYGSVPVYMAGSLFLGVSLAFLVRMVGYKCFAIVLEIVLVQWEIVFLVTVQVHVLLTIMVMFQTVLVRARHVGACQFWFAAPCGCQLHAAGALIWERRVGYRREPLFGNPGML